MAEVISSKQISRHNVDKYNFKVLAIGAAPKRPEHKQKEPSAKAASAQAKAPQQPQAQKEPQEQARSSSRDALIESLLKKTDEMSSNFIKLQMKLESMQEEHKKELEELKQSAFSEGVIKGKEEAQQECTQRYEQTLRLFGESIAKLEQKASEYIVALEGIKKELSAAAIDIAKEVVNSELESNSQKIAESLASLLIEELQGASKITLKVNPKDFAQVSQQLGALKHIEVVADAAVSEGGVIAISDLENIDAQIPHRFEQVKKVVLSE